MMKHSRATGGSRAGSFKVYGTEFHLDRKYTLLRPLGRGAYGVVCAAKNTETNAKVAIKKISPMGATVYDAKHTLREIRLMRYLGRHENIVTLRDLVVQKDADSLYVVMDLVDTDLHRIIQSSQTLTDAHYKHFMFQLLRGVAFTHRHGILHRDLKPSNLLVTKNCDLVITDFGLSRAAPEKDAKHQAMTEHVVTRWYRPPELMLSADGHYTAAVDVWSIGCIFAELIGRTPLFPGKNFMHQLCLIFDVIGTPPAEELAYIRSDQAISFMKSLPTKPRMKFSTLYPKTSPEAVDLLDKMLVFDPKKRMTIDDALAHPYFDSVRSQYTTPDPALPPTFEFDFEHKDLDPPALVKLIAEEAYSFRKEREDNKKRRQDRMAARARAKRAERQQQKQQEEGQTTTQAAAAAAGGGTAAGAGSSSSRDSSPSAGTGTATATATTTAGAGTGSGPGMRRSQSASRYGSRRSSSMGPAGAGHRRGQTSSTASIVDRSQPRSQSRSRSRTRARPTNGRLNNRSAAVGGPTGRRNSSVGPAPGGDKRRTVLDVVGRRTGRTSSTKSTHSTSPASSTTVPSTSSPRKTVHQSAAPVRPMSPPRPSTADAPTTPAKPPQPPAGGSASTSKRTIAERRAGAPVAPISPGPSKQLFGGIATPPRRAAASPTYLPKTPPPSVPRRGTTTATTPTPASPFSPRTPTISPIFDGKEEEAEEEDIAVDKTNVPPKVVQTTSSASASSDRKVVSGLPRGGEPHSTDDFVVVDDESESLTDTVYDDIDRMLGHWNATRQAAAVPGSRRRRPESANPARKPLPQRTMSAHPDSRRSSATGTSSQSHIRGVGGAGGASRSGMRSGSAHTRSSGAVAVLRRNNSGISSSKYSQSGSNNASDSVEDDMGVVGAGIPPPVTGLPRRRIKRATVPKSPNFSKMSWERRRPVPGASNNPVPGRDGISRSAGPTTRSKSRTRGGVTGGLRARPLFY